MKRQPKHLINLVVALLLLGILGACRKEAKEIPVSSVSLSSSSIELVVGESTTLSATVKPDDATDKKVTWASTDKSVATVGPNGEINAIAPGSTTIKASAGQKTATCQVTVKQKVIAVTSVTLDKESASIKVGETIKLTATVKPDDATDLTVSWSSDKESVATVDDKGNVKGVAGGSATITAKAGDKTAKCTITVTVPVSSVSIDKEEATIEIEETLTLKATVKPDDATDKTVTWSSDKETIATVDGSGNVKGVAEGTATITAKAGDKSATCKITVTVPISSVSLDKTEASIEVGGTLKLTATVKPSNATNKTVAWSSSSTKVATVDQDGNVTGVAIGSATITAKAGGKSATCKITVTEPAYIAQQRAALKAFYDANNGDNWKKKENWLSDKPFSEWAGLTVSDDGKYVTEIVFWGNNLKGYIPKEIADLTELTRLSISENEPMTSGYKALPSEIGKLKNLKDLTLQGYTISGSLPDALFDLPNLETLLLNNQIYMDPGPIPSGIGKLRKLHTLGLNSCNLTGSIPSSIGELYNLEFLRFNSNQLSGTIPSSIGNLINLDFFEVCDNKITGPIPTSVRKIDAYWKIWPGIVQDNDFSVEQLKESNLPAPRSPKITAISGKTLDIEAEFKKNQYTVFFSVSPEFSYSYAVEFLQKLEKLYKANKGKGLGIITYLDNMAEENDQKKWDDNFKKALKESGAEWESFIRYNFYNYPEGQAPLYADYGTNAYPSAGANSLVIVGPDQTVVYTNLIDKSGYAKKMDNTIAFLEDVLGSPIKHYESKNYNADGKVTTLQKASTGKGVDLIITGDAFSDRLISDGTFDKLARNAVANLFAVEPLKSLKDRFNIYFVNAVSKNEEYFNGSSTAFSGDFGYGSAVGGDNSKVLQYAQKAVSSSRMDNVFVLVLMNTGKTGGTCYMMDPEDQSIWGGGASVAYVPYNNGSVKTGSSYIAHTVIHELGGHGIGKLADEYYYIQNGRISSSVKEEDKSRQKIGWYQNIDFTSDKSKVLWAKFIGDSRFSKEKIGVYEGGDTYHSGVWRPTEQSVMFSHDIYYNFNAPSRAQIYRRIMTLSEGTSWKYDFETFAKWDQAHPVSTSSIRRSSVQLPEEGEFVHYSPVRVGKTWREVMEGR